MPTWSGDNWSLNPSHESDHSQLVTKLSVSNNILESQFTGGHVKEMLLKMKPHSNGKSGCRNWLRFVIFIWTHLLQSGVLMLQWGSLATTNWMNSLCFPKLLKSPRVGSHYLPSLWIVASFCEILYLHLICSGQLSTSPIGEKEQICNFQTSSHLHVNTSRPLAQWAKSHSQTLPSPRGFTFTMYTVQ